jgi:protein SCO1/2
MISLRLPVLMACGVLLLSIVGIRSVWGHHNAQHTPAMLEHVDLEQRLHAQVPLHVRFRKSTGEHVRLGEYFQDKPVILTLAYYSCDNLCPLSLDGLVKAMRVLPLAPGKDFTVLTVSIDPRDTPERAAATRQRYVRRYTRGGEVEGWHFLTGESDAVQRLAEAVGFRYRYDASQDQYAHASGIMVLTPTGVIARYLYGIEYAPRDLRFSLVEAAAHTIGTPIDRLLLLCYHYDPRTGQYGLIIMPILRIAALAMLLGLGAGVGLMLRRDLRARHHARDTLTSQSPQGKG